MNSNQMMVRAAVVCGLLLVSPAFSQAVDPANLTGERVVARSPADTLAINHGAAQLQQLLQKLRTRASMMLIVAHPDDEDGGFLTYESRGVGARVAMLTLTRGEGGQNLMSADFDDALGLIRTQELLAAGRYMGVDQMFGTEVDFGFSKTKEESFQKWTHERVLYDAVRAVRLYRPLVVASVFVGGVTDGHGHHQVSGEIAQEVFNAAADSKVFPEMGLPPWAPLKVYARVPFSRVTDKGMFDYATGKWAPPVFHNYVTGKDIDHEPTATVTIHEGAKSALLGMEGDSWVQFARKGLALQKTQIGGNVRLAPTGAMDVGYTLMGSRVKGQQATEASVFDGIDTSMPSIAGLAPSAGPGLRTALEGIDKQVAEAQRLFDAGKPDASRLDNCAVPLRDAMHAMDGLVASTRKQQMVPFEKFNLLHELAVKRTQLNDALAASLGEAFRVEVDVAGGQSALPIVPVTVGTELATTLKIDRKTELRVDAAGFTADGELPPPKAYRPGWLGQHWSYPTKIQATSGVVKGAAGDGWTHPYFSRKDLQQPYYDVADAALRNAPEAAPYLTEFSFFTFGDAMFSVGASPTPRLALAPNVSVAMTPAVGLVPAGGKPLMVKVTVHNVARGTGKGSVALTLPAGWKSVPATAPLGFQVAGETKEISFAVTPDKPMPGKAYTLTAVADVDGVKTSEGFRAVGYPGLVYTQMYTPATFKAVDVDVTTAPGLRVAYLPGTGDSVVDFLPNLGVTPTVIGMKDVTAAGLAGFDTVVLGVRAYAAHPELAGKGSGPLLEFAKAGGVVIVQYMTAKYGDNEAPYAIEVPGDPAHNVVVEAQPVTVVAPQAALLNWPNRITAADFGGWAAEYGHGFAASWGKEFEPMIEVHDPDQEPQKGGLLVAKVGKGAYVYCALALYRQLPEGVPGAYRVFANLLSYGKNPGR
jgi:LmbE family N-acetylglucosaminyl deacetylase